jgi:cell division protein FtsW
MFALAVAATAIGLVFIFDAGFAQALSDSRGFVPPEFRSQVILLVGVFPAYFLCASIRPETWKRLSQVVWIATLILLLAVRKFGHEVNGAQRWIDLHGIRLQPAEFAKLAIVLYLASTFCDRQKWPSKIPPRRDLAQRIETVWLPKLARCAPLLVVLTLVALVEIEPDLGTAAVLAATAFAMFIPGGVSVKTVLAGVVIFSLGAALLVMKEPYRMERITHHAQRWSTDNIDDTGYQTVQSELAQADGGLFGVGIGAGRAKHVLPETTSDFINATIGEETGLLGSLTVLSILGLLVWRLFTLAKQATSRFNMLILFGVGAWIGIQTCVNFMMANAFLPAIGIPLPFVSSGGSSLIALWMALGVCQATLAPASEKKEGAVATRTNRWRHRRPHLSRA